MSEGSFTQYLLAEVETSRNALLAMLLRRDELLYVKAPALRAAYMEDIGAYERQVLEAELVTALLQKKLELLRAAKNRRETIDEPKIAEQLEEEKARLIGEVEARDLTREELPQLSEEEQQVLQTGYREIVNAFHPGTHTEVSTAQVELYEKACDAYRRQDVQSMALLHEALFNNVSEPTMVLPTSDADYRALRNQIKCDALDAYATDYTLAASLFGGFEPNAEEQILQEKINKFKAQASQLEEEIRAIQASFPFNAKSTLNDEQKREDYLEDLKLRMRQSELSQKELNREIEELSEACHGR